jgi:nitric oxide dioxygenase
MSTGTQVALSVETLEESYDIIAPKIPEIVDRMYTRLFEVAPRVVKIFAGRDPSKQLRTVHTLRDAFDDLSSLTPELENLGERHASWGVQEQDYAIMGPILLEAMAASVDPYWRSEYTTAWAALFQTVADIMLRGAARSQSPSTG